MLKKNIIWIIFTAMILTISSCGLIHYNKVYLTDYSQRMNSLKLHFPEIYSMYCDGLIIIDEMYEYETKEGDSKVHISYHYR